MHFLNDTNTDIYISTWSETKLYIPIIRKTYIIPTETVPHNYAHIIEQPLPNAHTKAGELLLRRMRQGIQLIVNSQIEYSHILIIRPDILFHRSMCIHDFVDMLGSYDILVDYVCHSSKYMSDQIFFGRSDTIKEYATHLPHHNYSNDLNWHDWLYSTTTTTYNTCSLPPATISINRLTADNRHDPHYVNQVYIALFVIDRFITNGYNTDPADLGNFGKDWYYEILAGWYMGNHDDLLPALERQFLPYLQK